MGILRCQCGLSGIFRNGTVARPVLQFAIRHRRQAEHVLRFRGRAFSELSASQFVDVADVGPVGSVAAAIRAKSGKVEDPALRAAMLEGGCIQVVEEALKKFRKYNENKKAWEAAMDIILEDKADLKNLDAGKFTYLVQLLAYDAKVTDAQFWTALTMKAADILKSSSLKDAMEIAHVYTKIRAWEPEVFRALHEKVNSEGAIYWMTPAALVFLCQMFSRAGASSQGLSRSATQVFNELQERLDVDIDEELGNFSPKECLGLLESMARFHVVDRGRFIIKGMGRLHLHPEIEKGHFKGSLAANVCRAYGALGYRHDTVFKVVVGQVLEEWNARQAAATSGESALPYLEYSASDVALIAFAMLNLKMFRGDTSWFNWTEKYEALLNVLTLQLKAAVPTMEPEPLAAISFVLGRARLGSEELIQSMFARMMELLQHAPDADEPPQEFLERFMHGLAMMGPGRQKKYLQTDELMHWLCQNVHSLVLSDFVMINRHLVMMRCHDRDYLMTVARLFIAPDWMQRLTMSDIQELVHTYNHARITEDDLTKHLVEEGGMSMDNPGKHFFWALGRQYQYWEVNRSRQAGQRPQFRRIG